VPIPRQLRTRGRLGKTRLAFLLATVGALVACVATAYADDISNNIDTTVDAVAEVMPLTTGGANGTTQLYVVERNGDGKNGCNLTASTSLSISISSSNTAVATVSPSSSTFTACGDVKTLTVTPHDVGSATVSASLIANTTAGTFNLAPVTFTVNVAPPPNTPPQIAVAGVTGGASYNKGSVPSATCQVTDAEDGNSSFPATLSAITGPYANDGIGLQTASCSYTDAGGLHVEASETYGIVDPTAPLIGYTLNPLSPDGNNGWYRSNVSLTWDVSEPQSPSSLAKTGCVDQNITSDQVATTYLCSATSAGGSAGPVSVTIKRDGSKPTITADSGSYSPGTWTNQDVAISYTCHDVGPSGLKTACPDDLLLNGETDAVISHEIDDNAGNTGESNGIWVRIDKTPPVLSLPSNITDEATGASGRVVSYTTSASDTLSGLNGSISCSPASGSTFALGTTTVDCSAQDNAGNSASGSFDVTIQDTTPPALNLPGNITKEATGPSGAVVPYSASASDLVDGSTPVNCDHNSGSTFPLGTTTVHCSATDAHSNTANGSFTVTVQDTTAPSLNLPADITVYAVNNQAVVNYSASASDIVDGSVAINCTPASGSTFGPGTTTVNCSATDSHGNTANGSFKVNVIYRWSGFFQPVDNAAMNVAKSGSTIPVKFSLGGNQGLSVLLATPSVTKIGCSTGEPLDTIEEYTSSVASGLRYDLTADQYIYSWKTTSSYAGTCQRLSVKLADGTPAHTADFKFTK
jgi:hypothetical protein